MEQKKLHNNVEIVVPAEGLREKLAWSQKRKKTLRVKLGFDPTAPDLHLGHWVVLKKLRDFQEAGHQIVVIIGDFTACIGDPTGRNKTRPPLTLEEIRKNAETYLDQLGKVIDLKKTAIHWNSEWLDQLRFKDLITLLSKVTVSQILQRDDFAKRYESHLAIHMHELTYPIMQGYDSVQIESDVEIGGKDQLFNCLVGRDLQRAYGMREQIVLCLSILRGTDGEKKMGKSLNNYIGLAEAPEEIYGKVMSIPDSLLEEYFRLVSSFSPKEQEEKRAQAPMEAKKDLAFNIVQQLYGTMQAEASALYFYRQVQSRDEECIVYQDVQASGLSLSPPCTLLSLCSSLFPEKSKGDVRRLIQGGGVLVNGGKKTDPQEIIEIGKELKVKAGKRGYYRILPD